MPSRIAVAKELADIFRVLAHPDRIRLIEELRAGERDVNGLATLLELRATRVSQHLALLRAHRVVHERRAGRHVYYELTQLGLADWIIGGLDFLEERGSGDVETGRLVRRARELWSQNASAG